MKHLFLFLSFCSFSLLTACDKSGCLAGIIKDAKTGEPIPGANIVVGYHAFENDSLILHSEIVRSDQSGEFFYPTDEKENVHTVIIFKKGYSHVYEETQNKNKGCTQLEIQVKPLDGFLDLTIRNETGLHDSIFVQVFNKCDYKYRLVDGLYLTNPAILYLKQSEESPQTIPHLDLRIASA